MTLENNLGIQRQTDILAFSGYVYWTLNDLVLLFFYEVSILNIRLHPTKYFLKPTWFAALVFFLSSLNKKNSYVVHLRRKSVDLDQTAKTIIAADVLQLAVIAVSIMVFVYIRAACGPQARYLVHIALGYAGISVFYIFDIAVHLILGKQFKPSTEPLVQVIATTLSLINTTFFITAWYLMRDVRLERKIDPVNPIPTMSKPFAAAIIAGLMASIASFIGLAHILKDDPALSTLYVGIDAFLGSVVLLCIASEIAQMPLIKDENEGSLFEETSHLVFRVISVILFVMFAATQWGRLIWAISEWYVVTPQTGIWYHFSAMLKVLCAGALSILALHALPSVRWRHRALNTVKVSTHKQQPALAQSVEMSSERSS